MNPNQPQSMQGDLSALKAVMAQKGINTGILDQAVGGAPTANPANVPSPVSPQGAPNLAPTAPTPPVQTQVPQGMGLPAGDPEALMITKALAKRQETLGKLGR